VILSAAVTLAAIPSHAFAQMAGPSLWQPNPNIAAIDTALARIPDGATVSTSDNIAPQLTDRATVTLFGLAPLDAVRPAWILVDPHSVRHFRISREAEQRYLAEAKRNGYAVVLDRDGIVLLHDEH
jgi:hypothetical protein